MARANSKDSTNRHTTDPGRFESRHHQAAKEEEDFKIYDLSSTLQRLRRILLSCPDFHFVRVHLLRDPFGSILN